jgi:hypothetical protein
MSNENGRNFGEPVLTPEAARKLLIATGRAEAYNDGGLNVDLDDLDSIGLGALQINLAGEPSTLSQSIERVTARPPVLGPQQLGDMVVAALCPERPSSADPAI